MRDIQVRFGCLGYMQIHSDAAGMGRQLNLKRPQSPLCCHNKNYSTEGWRERKRPIKRGCPNALGRIIQSFGKGSDRRSGWSFGNQGRCDDSGPNCRLSPSCILQNDAIELGAGDRLVTKKNLVRHEREKPCSIQRNQSYSGSLCCDQSPQPSMGKRRRPVQEFQKATKIVFYCTEPKYSCWEQKISNTKLIRCRNRDAFSYQSAETNTTRIQCRARSGKQPHYRGRRNIWNRRNERFFPKKQRNLIQTYSPKKLDKLTSVNKPASLMFSLSQAISIYTERTP